MPFRTMRAPNSQFAALALMSNPIKPIMDFQNQVAQQQQEQAKKNAFSQLMGIDPSSFKTDAGVNLPYEQINQNPELVNEQTAPALQNLYESQAGRMDLGAYRNALNSNMQQLLAQNKNLSPDQLLRMRNIAFRNAQDMYNLDAAKRGSMSKSAMDQLKRAGYQQLAKVPEYIAVNGQRIVNPEWKAQAEQLKADPLGYLFGSKQNINMQSFQDAKNQRMANRPQVPKVGQATIPNVTGASLANNVTDYLRTNSLNDQQQQTLSDLFDAVGSAPERIDKPAMIQQLNAWRNEQLRNPNVDPRYVQAVYSNKMKEIDAIASKTNMLRQDAFTRFNNIMKRGIANNQSNISPYAYFEGKQIANPEYVKFKRLAETNPLATLFWQNQPPDAMAAQQPAPGSVAGKTTGSGGNAQQLGLGTTQGGGGNFQTQLKFNADSNTSVQDEPFTFGKAGEALAGTYLGTNPLIGTLARFQNTNDRMNVNMPNSIVEARYNVQRATKGKRAVEQQINAIKSSLSTDPKTPYILAKLEKRKKQYAAVINKYSPISKASSVPLMDVDRMTKAIMPGVDPRDVIGDPDMKMLNQMIERVQTSHFSDSSKGVVDLGVFKVGETGEKKVHITVPPNQAPQFIRGLYYAKLLNSPYADTMNPKTFKSITAYVKEFSDLVEKNKDFKEFTRNFINNNSRNSWLGNKARNIWSSLTGTTPGSNQIVGGF